MSLLVLSHDEVDRILFKMRPEDHLLLMAGVFSRFSMSTKLGADSTLKAGISMPPRLSITTEAHTALFMPARIGFPYRTGMKSGGDTAIKVVCVPERSGPQGLPSTTLVLDEVTGAVKAVVNSRKLTAVRNAAGTCSHSDIRCYFTDHFVYRLSFILHPPYSFCSEAHNGLWVWEADRSSLGSLLATISIHCGCYNHQPHDQRPHCIP